MTKEQVLEKNFLLHEDHLEEYATKNKDALRLNDAKEDIRPAFFRDIDRIIHSTSYTRYMDKTQVYSFKENDHITKRMVHVQLVSKIARTIGRALRLNEDLIEAIALGHDLGHTPLGHLGESLLDEITKRELNQEFGHNIQSVRNLMYVEKNGKGLNLTLQVLDGIMCHNGEILSHKYIPMKKDIKEFLRQYRESYTNLEATKKYSPMTLEGCVVRISDVVGYIGRDIEDAITLGLFKREDLPSEITKVLGNTNKEIVNTIILDIIQHSMNKAYIELSEDVYQALLALKSFNYKHIYHKSCSDEDYQYYKNGMNKLFEVYIGAIKKENKKNTIYTLFLNKQNEKYLNNTSEKRMVIDFISGMTDDFFLTQVKKHLKK